MKTFYEFFAGGGMAKVGLGPGWRCTFANDIDPMKAAAYRRNWGDEHLAVGDVNDVSVATLPGRADLAWASFPCQDLSLAGNYAGIGSEADAEHTRSGAFWAFWSKIRGLVAAGRAPRTIVLENVLGVLTSNQGRDFAAISGTLAGAGYRFGAMVVDAAHFLPQSRPRVFIVATTGAVPQDSMRDGPSEIWHPPALRKAHAAMEPASKEQWIWWDMPVPAERSASLEDIVEDDPVGVEWHTGEETARLLSTMDERNAAKVSAALSIGVRTVGTVYKRTRVDGTGAKRVRAEVRFDGTAGCLRTPSGGSSRQIVVVVAGGRARTRLLSPREAARLMGLPDSYVLPERYTDAYHVAGDGVAVPVVAWLRRHLFDRLAEEVDATDTAA